MKEIQTEVNGKSLFPQQAATSITSQASAPEGPTPCYWDCSFASLPADTT